MIDAEKLHKGIRSLNDGNHTQREMGRILGVGRTTIVRHIQLMEAEGNFKYKAPDRVYHPSKKVQLERETKRAMIKDLAAKGYSINRIAAELSIRHETVSLVVKEMIADGSLSEQRAIITRQTGKVVTPGKKKKIGQMVPSTLAPGKTIKCTGSVARTCVYGADNPSNGWCRFLSCTGQSRMMICPHTACTVYSKRSKENPKIIGYGDIDE